MRNTSIRTKILAGVVIVNLIGMITVMVYLHESYSEGLDDLTIATTSLSHANWTQLAEVAENEYGAYTTIEGAQKYVDSLKAVTGADYGIMLDKAEIDETAYAAMRDTAGLPNNWADRETYVLMAASDETAAERMQLNAAPADLPEDGKLVGVENGACSETCHGAVEGSGDFWTVRWSDDESSRGHGVFPISDASGQPVGTIYLIEDISHAADSARTSQMRTMWIIMFGLVLSTVLIFLMLNAFIFSRLSRMVSSIEDISVRVAGGDFDARFEPDGTNDEIGRFEQFFARFMDLVSGTLKSLVK